jgi:hypothetical protein
LLWLNGFYERDVGIYAFIVRFKMEEKVKESSSALIKERSEDMDFETSYEWKLFQLQRSRVVG